MKSLFYWFRKEHVLKSITASPLTHFFAIIGLAALVLACMGCSDRQHEMVVGKATVLREAAETEATHQLLRTATPVPKFDRSLERENLVRRLKSLNVQNKVMWIYCMSLDGKVVYFGPVQGKVSSLNSLLTTPDQIVSIRTYGNGFQPVRVASPDLDGSYGKNPDGIFWFEPSGAYHEWTGAYFLSDRPTRVNTPVSLTTTIDPTKKKSTK